MTGPAIAALERPVMESLVEQPAGCSLLPTLDRERDQRARTCEPCEDLSTETEPCGT